MHILVLQLLSHIVYTAVDPGDFASTISASLVDHKRATAKFINCNNRYIASVNYSLPDQVSVMFLLAIELTL